LIAQVPPERRNKQCICRRCITAFLDREKSTSRSK
jgi:hypothetical protein